MSPTQRSLKKLRDEGYLVAITERWNPYAHIRQDLFGFIDLLAIRGNEVLAVQTTSGTNVAARVAKLLPMPAVALWTNSPHRKVVIHGWRKVGAKGKRKVWECREVPIYEVTPKPPPPPSGNPGLLRVPDPEKSAGASLYPHSSE